MRGRLGSLAMFTAMVLVALLAFPGSAGASHFGDVKGVPWNLPQFGLEILAEPQVPAEVLPLDLIGEEVATCFERGGFGFVCRLNQVSGTAAGQSSGVPEVKAVEPLVTVLTTPPQPAPARVATRGCYQGVCPVIDPVSPWLSENHGLCTFCSDTHSVGTTSAVRLGVL